MAERWKTFKLPLEGGLLYNEDLLKQSEQRPGTVVQGINFEPSPRGGYRRINGYTDLGVVGGGFASGKVLGVFVFAGSFIAVRGGSVYWGGSGGVGLNDSAARNGAIKARAAKYNFNTPTIMIVDGTNKPCRYEPAIGLLTGYSEVTDAPSGAHCIAEFRQHIFLGVGSHLFWSQPTDDIGWDAGLGAGEINVGQDIVNIYPFRDELYIFCATQIYKLTGSHYANFELVPVTKNIGCVAADSIQEVGGSLMFLGPDGIRTIAATERIGDIEVGSISRAIQSIITDLATDYGNDNICAAVVREKSQYRLFASDETVDKENSFGILGGIRESKSEGTNFEWFELKGFRCFCADSGYIDEEEWVLHGDFDGRIYRQEIGNSIGGSSFPYDSIEYALQTPYLTFDDPTVRKTLYKLDAYIDFESSQEAEITLNVFYDYLREGVSQPAAQIIEGAEGEYYYNDNAYYDDGVTRYADVAATVVKKNLIGSGMTASFKFSGTDHNDPFVIRSLVVQYNVDGRR